jgi:hypothetical protein
MMPPKDWYEPLIMPGILTFFGVLIFWMGWLSERGGKTAGWKWLGLLFLLWGMWLGYTNYFAPMVGQSSEDVLYRAGMPSVRRYAYAHYLAFIMPLLGLVFGIVLQFIKRRPAPAAPADS